MSKLESGEVVPAHEVVNLNELSNDIQAIVGQRAAEAGVSLCYNRLSNERVYPYVYGSPLHLRQIFLNIYGDAIKYNHVGGSVKTHLTCFGAENGTITVKSAPNEGSTFAITLPFEIAYAQQPVVRETGEKDSIRGLHLLLAEDNELNAEIAETLLRDKGAEITVVSDGAQAIEKFTDSPAGTYNAIIMDIMMPEVDGLAATRAICAMKRPDAWRIPIIAMTANAFDEDVRHCLATGMNAHLAKPLQIDSIVQTIAELCNK
nr:response regulator [Butyricicoccus sp. BIOML-A1]